MDLAERYELKIISERGEIMRKCFEKICVRISAVMLIMAMCFAVCACGNKPAANNATTTTEVATNVVGEGSVQFAFEVVDADGNTEMFTVNTDKKTVGEALLECDLIAGDDSEYGLYVKTVNGITADYDVDGTYWAFYIDGEYASTGVDQTDVVAGATYSFKVEK